MKIKLLWFLCLIEKILPVIFFEKGTVDENSIEPCNRLDPSYIRLFITAKKS